MAVFASRNFLSRCSLLASASSGITVRRASTRFAFIMSKAVVSALRFSGLAAGGRLGPRSGKGVSVLAEGKRGKGHGDDKRRSRDGEYLKRNRGFESGSLQRGVWCEPHFLDQGGPLGFAPRASRRDIHNAFEAVRFCRVANLEPGYLARADQPVRGPANPSPRNYGQARCAGIFGTGTQRW